MQYHKILKVSIFTIAYLVILVFILFRIFQLPQPPYQHQFQGLIIAHRGASAYAPENTLSAIKLAAEMGADAVEIDVQLTQDHILVAFHDATVERTTNGTGLVSAMNLIEFQTLDAAFNHPDFLPEKPPTIAEVIELTEKLGLVVELDIKADNSDWTSLINALLNLYEEYDIYGRVYVSSFSPSLTYQIKKQDPNIITGHSVYSHYNSPTTDYLLKSNWLPTFLGASLIEPHIDLVTETTIAQWKAKGYAINVWTVNKLEVKQWLQEQGVSYTTDCPNEDCAD